MKSEWLIYWNEIKMVSVGLSWEDWRRITRIGSLKGWGEISPWDTEGAINWKRNIVFKF